MAFAQESVQDSDDELTLVVEDQTAFVEADSVEEAEDAMLVMASDDAEAEEDDQALASAATADYNAYLTFSDSTITETSSGSGYSIDGTTLTISSAGTYRLGGSCSEGAVVVKASDVVIELDGLTLASSSTAPIVVKKTCTGVCIHMVDGTTSTITNNEDPANEESTDTEVADAFEGACIKVKTDPSVTFCGGGNLKCVANTKNGIKGGTNASLTFNTTGKVSVSGSYSGYATSAGAVNNGIASDGSLTFNAGTYVVAAANDGIKAVPDSDDTTSAGDITINGGTFDLDVDGDGIQAEHNLTITAGSFNIKTMSGYTTSGFDEDTMSCKGIKASGDREDVENTISISGGSFTINTIDDAVHSDMYVTVTGGLVRIQTGDDGMHADTTLTLGTEGGFERDPSVYISSSYEGLEAGNVYMYSGRFYVIASDDGVNAAGGSSSGTDAGQPGNDGFRPGGGPGNPGNIGNTGSSDYNVYIYGGELYVNCNGDGLDSNGGLYLYGGRQAVFSQGGSGDNSAIDADGTISINGATIITAGIAGMDGSAQSSWFGSNQKYKAASSSYSAGTVLNAKASSTIMMSYKLPKKVSYVMASWPSSVSSSAPTFATASSLTSCKSSSWEHSWNSGSTSNGVTTYTCSSCKATERQTVATSASVDACDHTVEVEDAITEYTATFSIVDDDGAASSNASINIYYTQDYATADETGVTTAIARNSDTGEADVSGSGQINFTVVPASGYSVADVSVSGSYKNVKGPADTGVANTYRITKVAGDLTITVTVTACAHENVTGPTWTWSDDCATATAAFACSDCNSTVEIGGAVSSELTDASTITFTATAELNGTTYTDTKTAAPLTATFAGDEGFDSVDVYYTKDATVASEEGVTTAVARDGDTGCPVIDGSGQLNFLVHVKDGYNISDVTATSGTYKNIKGPSDTGLENTYRITKVTADTTITVTTEKEATYTVAYEFVSNTDGYELPSAVSELLPTDGNEYTSGTTVTPVALETTSVAVDGGTWTFSSWSPTSATISDANVTFTGTWTFAADEAETYGVAYEFVSATDGCELPSAVADLLPTDTGAYVDGSVVTAATLGTTEVAVEGGTWSFGGWDEASKTVSGADVTFTGAWTFEETVLTEVAIPTGASLTYTGEEQTGVVAGEGYILDGTTSATNAGSYTATATLEDGCIWSDGTSDAKSIAWEIAKAASTIELAEHVEAYTGSAVSYTGTVTKTGSTGAVTYAYYKDEACTKTATPKKPGVYYVKATLAADANYAEVTSAAAKLTVRFLDVPESHEYFSDVHAAASLGIVNGYSGSKLGYFGPEDSLQRGQVAVMLWNLAGKPAAGSSAKSFKDVSSSAYYAKAVAWASSVGVVNGYSGKKAGYFGPRDNVTHEQLCVMIRNYAKMVAGISTKGSASDYASFSDAGDVSSWAVASVGWCFAGELTTGFDGLVNPQGEATRAETASMTYLLSLLIGG